MEEKIKKCSVSKKCGSCQYQGVPYKEQLAAKQKQMSRLLKKFGNVKPIIGMDDPFYYRNKVHAVFDSISFVHPSFNLSFFLLFIITERFFHSILIKKVVKKLMKRC